MPVFADMDMVPHLLMTPTESHMTALVMRRQGTGVLQRMPCHDLYSPGGMIATGAAILCYIRMQKGCALYAQQDVPVHYLDSKIYLTSAWACLLLHCSGHIQQMLTEYCCVQVLVLHDAGGLSALMTGTETGAMLSLRKCAWPLLALKWLTPSGLSQFLKSIVLT